MYSCRGSVCLLVLLGAVLASGGPIQYISENIKHAQESIADELGLKMPEIASEPVFTFIIKSVNTTCWRRDDIQLMNATLDVYKRIFSSILHEHSNHHSKTQSSGLLDHLSEVKRSNISKHLRKLQQKMEDLKNHLNSLNSNKDRELRKLEAIKVDDPMVQKKAMAEFLEVFQTASVIGSCSR
ncbi:interferon gamma 1-like [Cololabis saira]|uniref:interferon gamma 1-like n=1 Tax=Cololabis saira TaxID=129043 RepID=UPI002AD436F8|nr:interferon gamma 1-like [Cololabis saira]